MRKAMIQCWRRVAKAKIIKQEKIHGIKRSLDVRLSRIPSFPELEAINERLFRPGYKKTFICYYLPGMEIGKGAWATGHFTPELKIEILNLQGS